MIQDYEIKSKETKVSKWVHWVEFILVLIILQSIIGLFFTGQAEEAEIRFRVLAHSNAEEDQAVKVQIQREIEPLIHQAVANAKNVDELGENLEALEETILDVANRIAQDVPVTLERTDALFPAKRSGVIVHPQAVHDAYILTIGSGRGDNWWCSLFPKVCFPDKKDNEDEKVTFFIWEWIRGLFS